MSKKITTSVSGKQLSRWPLHETLLAISSILTIIILLQQEKLSTLANTFIRVQAKCSRHSKWPPRDGGPKILLLRKHGWGF